MIAIDEVEAETVGQIFKWLVTEKTSLRQIAYWLTEAQIPIPGRDYNRPGTVWSSSTVRRMLSNASYIGKFSYGGYTINLPEMAIVSEEQFNLVQDILNGNKQWQRKKGRDATPGRYLLLDHFFCACQYRMTGRTMHKSAKYIYYRCVTSSYPKHKNPCTEINVRAQMADEIVWEWLKTLMKNEGRLRKGLNQMAAKRESQSKTKRDRLSS